MLRVKRDDEPARPGRESLRTARRYQTARLYSDGSERTARAREELQDGSREGFTLPMQSSGARTSARVSARPGRHAGACGPALSRRGQASAVVGRRRCTYDVPQAVDAERSSGSCSRAETGLSWRRRRTRYLNPVLEEDEAITPSGWDRWGFLFHDG